MAKVVIYPARMRQFLYTDPGAQAAIMGVRGKTLVREKYSWSTIADRYEQLCAELAQRKVHTGCDS